MLIPADADKLFELRFPALADRLCLIRVLVKKAVEEVGCCDDSCEKIVIALNEACMNIIQHAYADRADGEAIFECYRDSDFVYFKLVDFADPIDLEQVKPRELDDVRPGGLGVHFIREIMDDSDMGHLPNNGGNYLEMKKSIA